MERFRDPIVLKIKERFTSTRRYWQGEKTDVETHENKHFEDFKALKPKMKHRAVDQALKAGRANNWGIASAWLKYDRCVKSAEFHRKGAVIRSNGAIRPTRSARVEPPHGVSLPALPNRRSSPLPPYTVSPPTR